MDLTKSAVQLSVVKHNSEKQHASHIYNGFQLGMSLFNRFCSYQEKIVKRDSTKIWLCMVSIHIKSRKRRDNDRYKHFDDVSKNS